MWIKIDRKMVRTDDVSVVEFSKAGLVEATDSIILRLKNGKDVSFEGEAATTIWKFFNKQIDHASLVIGE